MLGLLGSLKVGLLGWEGESFVFKLHVCFNYIRVILLLLEELRCDFFLLKCILLNYIKGISYTYAIYFNYIFPPPIILIYSRFTHPPPNLPPLSPCLLNIICKNKQSHFHQETEQKMSLGHSKQWTILSLGWQISPQWQLNRGPVLTLANSAAKHTRRIFH